MSLNLHSFINSFIYSTNFTFYMPSTVLGVGNGQSPDSYEDYFLVVGERKQVIIYQVMCVMEENRGIRSISDSILCLKVRKGLCDDI